MNVDVAFTGVAVSELVAAREFFERLFGRPADIMVNADEEMWRVAEAAWLYVVVDPPRAGHALVALAVPDLDAALSELEDRGLRPVTVELVGDAGSKKATLRDPDGNTVAVIEVE
jgi:predicted enzyme related to lactoylglutathione lyase